eukprot:scaffold391_cov350-Prasinococcus_capsulatus_cf.AAC.2
MKAQAPGTPERTNAVANGAARPTWEGRWEAIIYLYGAVRRDARTKARPCGWLPVAGERLGGGEEGHRGGLGGEHAAPQGEGLEARGAQQRQLRGAPAALGPHRHQQPPRRGAGPGLVVVR